jgi:curved DNA-binding protein CbpA
MKLKYFIDLLQPEYTTKTEISEYQIKMKFKELAKVFHPDKGGTKDQFQEIYKEYEFLRTQIGKNYSDLSGFDTFTESKTINDFEEFLSSLEPELWAKYQELKALNIDSEKYTLEICGSWLWIETTKEFKDYFKSIGFKWAKEKKLWFYHSGEYKKFYSKDMTIDDIRKNHGSIRPGQSFSKQKLAV